MEVELGWGVHDLGSYDHLSPGARVERAYLRRLLDRCEETNIPILFNVVGHLLLDGCDGDHAGPYPSNWFDADPGTDRETDGLFYAPDIVDRIAASPVAHELCSHTFSHTPPTSPTETIATDLERAQRLHERRFGERPVSFVPPRHDAPPRDVLIDAGVEIVRVGRPTKTSSRAERFRELLLEPVPTWEPQLVDGIVETYCTTYPSLTAPAFPLGQRPGPHPVFRVLPQSLRKWLHLQSLRRTVDYVATHGRHVNLWCHLYDLANEHQWELLSEFIGTLAQRRDTGDIEVLTLAALNDRVRGRVAPKL